MNRATRRKALKTIRDLCLMDDTFFHTCLSDYKAGMEYILRIILEDERLVVVEMHTQEDVPNIYGRAVIFDVFVRDGRGREYNVEVQRAEAGADPNRARYHASLMDTMHVGKGTKWKNLPPAVVIFITETDVLRGGKPIYHVRRTIQELDDKRFEDHAEIIYVNASIQDDTPLGQLMQDFSCKDPKKMHAEVLATRAEFFKTDKHGVRTMSKVLEEFAKEFAKEYAAEERAEGKAEGIAEKTLRTILNQLKRHADYKIIASDNETTIDEVIRIAKENNLAY